MNRTLAPSGTPVYLRDLADCINQLGQAPAESLTRHIQARLGIDHAFLFSTGRGAMTFLLQCMRKENNDEARQYVVVPSYTCYSVVASVLKSGLKVLICDIDVSTLSFSTGELNTIDFTKVLAVINTSLYGLPCDLRKIEAIAAKFGVYLIDDAAQSLGASYAGRPSGTFGDAGILSFDKGKVVTSINGGAIVSNNAALSGRIKSEYSALETSSLTARIMDLAKLSAYFIMLRPSVYWVPSSLPFLKLGETRYDESYEVARYFDALAPLVEAQIGRMGKMNEHRRRCAALYTDRIPDVRYFVKIRPDEDCDPGYLRFPLLITDAELRRRFLNEYRSLGCSISYPKSIADLPEISQRIRVHNGLADGGRKVAAELVTLPTHHYVTSEDVDSICCGLVPPENRLGYNIE